MIGPWDTTTRLLFGLAAYFALYIALDWISLIDPIGVVGITPWNPPAGLSFALLLRHGLRFVPAVFAAVVTADVLLHGLSPEPVAIMSTAAIIAGGYGIAAELVRTRFHASPALGSQRDLLALLAVALLATGLVAGAVVSTFLATGLLSWSDVPAALQRFWVGDIIGIAVLTPFLLLLDGAAAAPRRRELLEFAGQLGAILLGLWAIFFFEPTDHFELSYLLFLPLVWIALRGGLRGATWGIVITQLGLVLAIQMKGYGADVITQFQLLMLAVATTGLFLGTVVDERRRMDAWLKAHEAELAHAARLTTMGEMAAALAHELNQPLTALISFARASESVLRAPTPDPAAARDTALQLIVETVQQANRAGEMIRSAREFVRRDDIRRVATPLGPLVGTVLELVWPEAAQGGVRIDTRLATGLPPVLADPIQVEQVMLNLLRNAIAAMHGAPRREIVLAAAAAPPGFVEFSVADTGPGFPAELADRLFRPFSATTGSLGMGLGLAICRSIVEAHGGRIWVPPREGGGGEVRFTLPSYPGVAS